jgi:hypothetical protein
MACSQGRIKEESMNTAKYVLVVGVAFLSLGCPTRALFVLFTEKELVSVPAIVGTWINGKGETYSFQKLGGYGYNVVWRDHDGNAYLYNVQLGRLDKHWFLDSYLGTKGHDYHMIAAHIISKMWIDGGLTPNRIA